jgi:hypothetical protein
MGKDPDLSAFDELRRLDAQLRELTAERARKVKEFVRTQAPERLEPVLQVERQIQSLHAQMAAELARVQREHGITDEILSALEEAETPTSDEKYLRREVESTSSTGHFEDGISDALRALDAFAPKAWLEREAQKLFRLGTSYQPIHIVAGTRLVSHERPQRFARMLLVARDFLADRADLDFFDASVLLPEVFSLGSKLDAARRLGPEATRRLEQLHQMPDDMVASSVYELLVGIAAVERGHDVEMLAPSKSEKTPDLRLTNFAVPAVIECKRRMGITTFEYEEARAVEGLYALIRPHLQQQGAHVSLEIDFRVPVAAVAPREFADSVELALKEEDEALRITSFGTLRCARLPYVVDLPRCRAFSPIFLERAFGWAPLRAVAGAPEAEQWDGLLCEVEPLEASLARRARGPNCVKWRSTSVPALTKKARGVASLWGQAAQQIPDGEMGFLYICYPEGARPAIADDRTRDLLERVEKRYFHHRPTVSIPLTIVNRVYANPQTIGLPDLIESSIYLLNRQDRHLLRELPINVFTPPPPLRPGRT